MDIKLPNLGEGADSGTVVSVLVNVGDSIAAEQGIIEMESEKAVATIPSSAAGTVAKIHVEPGQNVSAGTLLLTLEGGGGVERDRSG